MHVGLIIYGTLDTLSGGYRYDRELVRRLEARGARVTCFSQRWRPYALRLLDNVDRELPRRVEAAGLDLLLEDELNHPSLLRLGARLPAAPPRVAIVHHLRVSERHPAAWRPIYRLVERRYLDGVDGFLCNSHTTAAAVRALSPRSRPLAVAEPAGGPVSDPPDPGRRAAGGALRILFVGSVIPRKGLHVLLEAVGRLPAGSWRLDVAGDLVVDPGYAAACRRRAAALPGDAVRFHGRVDDRALDALYRRAHVLCVPSRYEGYGIVYAEALQYGVPVIATRAGAAHEVVEDGVSGYLVPPEDPSAVAARLAALQDRDRRAVMSVAALARAAVLPTWRESMDRAVDFLFGVAAGPALRAV